MCVCVVKVCIVQLIIVVKVYVCVVFNGVGVRLWCVFVCLCVYHVVTHRNTWLHGVSHGDFAVGMLCCVDKMCVCVYNVLN